MDAYAVRNILRVDLELLSVPGERPPFELAKKKAATDRKRFGLLSMTGTRAIDTAVLNELASAAVAKSWTDYTQHITTAIRLLQRSMEADTKGLRRCMLERILKPGEREMMHEALLDYVFER